MWRLTFGLIAAVGCAKPALVSTPSKLTLPNGSQIEGVAFRLPGPEPQARERILRGIKRRRLDPVEVGKVISARNWSSRRCGLGEDCYATFYVTYRAVGDSIDVVVGAIEHSSATVAKRDPDGYSDATKTRTAVAYYRVDASSERWNDVLKLAGSIAR